MKESNRSSRDPKDDTDLDLDGLEGNLRLEVEIPEAPENPRLMNQLSRDPEDDTDLEIDGIEDKIHLEVETVDLLLEQGQQCGIDLVTEQGSQDRIDVVLDRRSLERRLKSRDTTDTEDRRSHH